MVRILHDTKFKIETPDNNFLIVTIYPVGLWLEARETRRRKRWCFHFKSMWRQIKRREWRNVKNSFNGYLAEPDIFPHGLHRCGSGWTRRRALRDLQRRVNKSVR
jgi:hypothetical protein